MSRLTILGTLGCLELKLGLGCHFKFVRNGGSRRRETSSEANAALCWWLWSSSAIRLGVQKFRSQWSCRPNSAHKCLHPHRRGEKMGAASQFMQAEKKRQRMVCESKKVLCSLQLAATRKEFFFKGGKRHQQQQEAQLQPAPLLP
jgi:hypothetical protein